MKLGAEKKGQVIALVVLLLAGGFLLWRNLAPASDASAPAMAAPLASSSSLAPGLARLDPTLHAEKLDQLRAREYKGSGRDLFHFGAAPVEAPVLTPAARAAAAHAAAVAATAHPIVPAGPPPPPPIPLKFYGFAESSDAPEKIFLQLGDDTYVVTAGETIAHRYQIESIGKVSVRVKDLMTQSEQELPLQKD